MNVNVRSVPMVWPASFVKLWIQRKYRDQDEIDEVYGNGADEFHGLGGEMVKWRNGEMVKW
jgi:hypothetical protein